MITKSEIMFLSSILEHTLPIEERLLTEQDVPVYVGRICEELETVEYKFCTDFTIGQLIEALDWIVAFDTTLDESKKGFFSKASGALKGVISKGLASAQDKYHGWRHNVNADNMSKAHSDATIDGFNPKANKRYIDSYQAAAKHQMYADPKEYKRSTAAQLADYGTTHGSEKAAHQLLYHGRQMRRVVVGMKPRGNSGPIHSPTMDMPTNPGRPRSIKAK
jgi:hypothetical protein